MKSNVVVVVAFMFPAISLAQVTQPLQTSLDPASCLVPGQISTFSGCSTFYSTDEYCSSMPSTNSLDFQSCYCDQAVLDSIFECQSEERLCAGLPEADSIGESAVSVWHSHCDTAISFTPTTPPISSITVPYDTRCNSPLFDACATGIQMISSCGDSYTGAVRTSCFCQEPLLSAAFTCDYIANSTCYHLPITSSNIWGSGFCSNFDSFFSSMLTQEASYKSSLILTANASPFGATQTTTASQTRPSIPSGLSSSTPTSKASEGVRAGNPGYIFLLVGSWLVMQVLI